MRVAWDEREAEANAHKHGVTFGEASTVFLDPLALIIEDPGHPGRARMSCARSARGEPRAKSGGFMKKASRRGQREPSRRSLNEMPEVDFRKVRVKRNRYARLIAQEGLVLQVGRGRPRRVLEAGETSPRSVRFPDRIWTLLERHARAKGLTLHAALREAILDWARRQAS